EVRPAAFGPVLEGAALLRIIPHVAEQDGGLKADNALAGRSARMPVDDEQILPAAVLQVDEAGAPADVGLPQGGDARLGRAKAEEVLLQWRARLPVVLVQGVPLVLVIGHKERRQAGSVIVGDVKSHAAVGFAL